MSSIPLPIVIQIDGAPVPWKAHGGFGRRSFNPRYEEKEYFQFHIKRFYLNNFPITVAVKIHYIFFVPMPKTSLKQKEKMLANRTKPIKRPDISNMVKFTEDTLKGIVIKDDSQVVSMVAEKFYSENPRTIITIDLA